MFELEHGGSEIMKRLGLLFALALMLTLFAPGCAGEDDEESIDELLAQGKVCLSENDHGCAYQAFKKVLNRKPGHEQAEYGVVLANDQSLSFGLSGILDILSAEPYAPTQDECFMLCTNLDRCGWLNTWALDMDTCVEMCDPQGDASFGYSEDVFTCTAYAQSCNDVKECLSPVIPPEPSECIDVCFGLDECGFMTSDTYGVLDCIERCPNLYSRQEAVCFLDLDDCGEGVGCFSHYGPLVQQLIDSFYYEIPDDAIRYAADLFESDGFDFYIDYLVFSPLELVGVPDLLASGGHDKAAVHLYASFADLYRAVFKIALAFNIDINTNTFDYLPALPDDIFDFRADIDFLWGIVHMLRDILYDPARPNFGYMTDGGAELLPSASYDIAQAARDLRLFIEELKAKEAFAFDDAFPLEDFDGDGIWSEGESVYLRGWMALDYGFARDLQDLFEVLEATFDEGEPFPLSALKPIFSHYELEPINIIIDVLGLLGIDEVDLSRPLLDPHPDGIRDYIDQAIFILEELIQILEGLAPDEAS